MTPPKKRETAAQRDGPHEPASTKATCACGHKANNHEGDTLTCLACDCDEYRPTAPSTNAGAYSGPERRHADTVAGWLNGDAINVYARGSALHIDTRRK